MAREMERADIMGEQMPRPRSKSDHPRLSCAELDVWLNKWFPLPAYPKVPRICPECGAMEGCFHTRGCSVLERFKEETLRFDAELCAGDGI